MVQPCLVARNSKRGWNLFLLQDKLFSNSLQTAQFLKSSHSTRGDSYPSAGQRQVRPIIICPGCKLPILVTSLCLRDQLHGKDPHFCTKCDGTSVQSGPSVHYQRGSEILQCPLVRVPQPSGGLLHTLFPFCGNERLSFRNSKKEIVI